MRLRNSTCSFNHRPCVYGTINVQTRARRVERRVLLPPRRASSSCTAGTLLQDYIRQFGFGADTGIDLPFEFDGRIPDDALKAELVDKGVLAEGETPKLLLGDEINMAIGQGLLAASPLQLAVGYSAIANGGYVMMPRVMSAILAPNTPDGAIPGTVDMTQAVVVQAVHAGRASRSTCRGDVRNAIHRRHPPERHRARAPTAAAPPPRSCSPPTTRATPSTSPARPARRRASGRYPWNDSSVFAGVAYGDDALAHPYTVVALPREGRATARRGRRRW